jgi:hypothetical protein
MRTMMTIYHPNGDADVTQVTLEEVDGSVYASAKKLIQPHLGDGRIEHVTVLHAGRRHDMFVDEDFQSKDLPLNVAATAIYRNATLAREPDTDPETLPVIQGTAILFSDIIWR